MQKKKKIFVIIIITFLFCCIFKTVYAVQTEDNVKTIVTVSSSVNPDDYKPDDLSESESSSSMVLANKIIGAFQAIGSITSVLVLVLLGIKFVLGSAEEKAEYKQWMIYYIIGAVLVFAISNISAMIYDAIKS